MAENLNPTYISLVYSGVGTNATGNGSAFTLPLLDSYAFILDVTSAAGTTEKLDLAIQFTPDGGTTWYDWWRFAQVTTSAVTQCLVVQPMLGHGEAGTVATTTTGATNASISSNKSFPGLGGTNTCRIAFVISGTLPVYTFKLWLLAASRSSLGTTT